LTRLSSISAESSKRRLSSCAQPWPSSRRSSACKGKKK
jgi:hypothetical protein